MLFPLSSRIKSLTITTVLILASSTACGGSPKEAQAPTDMGDAYEDGDDEELSEEEAALLEQIEADEPLDDAPAVEGDAPPEGEVREVVYRLSQDGLRIQINGAEFVPKAEAVRVSGGWGVTLTIDATSEEERVLWAPKNGPLAFGGNVKRGSIEKFGDKREGGSELILSPDKPLTFSRTWPQKGEKGLRSGETLELQVGLWGLGPDAETRSPVLSFLVVKMTAGKHGAQPVIQPARR